VTRKCGRLCPCTKHDGDVFGTTSASAARHSTTRPLVVSDPAFSARVHQASAVADEHDDRLERMEESSHDRLGGTRNGDGLTVAAVAAAAEREFADIDLYRTGSGRHSTTHAGAGAVGSVGNSTHAGAAGHSTHAGAGGHSAHAGAGGHSTTLAGAGGHSAHAGARGTGSVGQSAHAGAGAVRFDASALRFQDVGMLRQTGSESHAGAGALRFQDVLAGGSRSGAGGSSLGSGSGLGPGAGGSGSGAMGLQRERQTQSTGHVRFEDASRARQTLATTSSNTF